VREKPAKLITEDDALEDMTLKELEPMLSERIEKWSEELRAEGKQRAEPRGSKGPSRGGNKGPSRGGNKGQGCVIATRSYEGLSSSFLPPGCVVTYKRLADFGSPS